MHRISDNRLIIQDQDRALLGIRTCVVPRGYVAQHVTALARKGAMFIRDGRTTPWPIRRVVPVDGEFYLAGPMVDGETLEELLPRDAHGSAPVWLSAFFRAALVSLEHPTISFGNIRTSLIVRDNGVLFFNAELAREINRSIPAHHQEVVHLPYVDGRLSGTVAARYQIAALLYHALTGSAPERQDEARTVVITPIHLRRPEVDKAIAELIDRILAGTNTKDGSQLEDIDSRLKENGGRWLEEISTEDAGRRRNTASETYRQAAQSSTRQAFWRRNRTRVVIAAALVILIGTIPYTMIRSYLEPPQSAGLAPQELVEQFYRARTELDHIFMEDAVARGVARGLIREVTNIYVIDRVQTAHSMHSRFMPPREWIAAGSPTDMLPYGVTDLRVDIVQQNTDQVIMDAEYDLWRPETGNEGESPISRVRVRDRLELEPTRHGWEITGISSRVLEQETIRRRP